MSSSRAKGLRVSVASVASCCLRHNGAFQCLGSFLPVVFETEFSKFEVHLNDTYIFSYSKVGY